MAGFGRRVAQVRDRHQIFGLLVLGGGEIERRRAVVPQFFPLRDELFVNGVELIVFRVQILQPIPLHDSRLEERRRRVGVVLEKLRRRVAVVHEIEAAVDRGRFSVPRPFDRVDGGNGNPEFDVPLLVDDVLSGLEADPLQLVCRRLDLVDLAAAEHVVRAFVPVQAALGVMVDEPLAPDGLFPVLPRLREKAEHYEPRLVWPAAVEPRPPRTTPVRAIGVDANGVAL